MVNLHIPFTFLLLGRVPCSQHTETVFLWGESPRKLLLYVFECENKASHVLTQVHSFPSTCVVRIIIRTHRSERAFTHAVEGGAVNAVTQSFPLTSQLDTILAHCRNVCACLFVLSGILWIVTVVSYFNSWTSEYHMLTTRMGSDSTVKCIREIT